HCLWRQFDRRGGGLLAAPFLLPRKGRKGLSSALPRPGPESDDQPYRLQRPGLVRAGCPAAGGGVFRCGITVGLGAGTGARPLAGFRSEAQRRLVGQGTGAGDEGQWSPQGPQLAGAVGLSGAAAGGARWIPAAGGRQSPRLLFTFAPAIDGRTAAGTAAQASGTGQFYPSGG